MKKRSFEPAKQYQPEKNKDNGVHKPRRMPENVTEDVELQNTEVKERMAQELMAMGLSREAVKRILRLDLTEERGENSKITGIRMGRHKTGATSRQGLE